MSTEISLGAQLQTLYTIYNVIKSVRLRSGSTSTEPNNIKL